MSEHEVGDAVLWRAMRDGDLSALGALFDRHADRVYRYSARAAASVEDAEDALSEIFLEAWRSRRAFTVEDGSALPVLLAVAKRVLQKQHRTSVRGRVRPPASARPAGVTEDIADTVVMADELAQRRTWLRSEVAALPTPYRNVYELCVYAELSQQEAARALGVPLGTVKSRLSRAKRIIADSAHRTFGVTAGIGDVS